MIEIELEIEKGEVEQIVMGRGDQKGSLPKVYLRQSWRWSVATLLPLRDPSKRLSITECFHLHWAYLDQPWRLVTMPFLLRGRDMRLCGVVSCHLSVGFIVEVVIIYMVRNSRTWWRGQKWYSHPVCPDWPLRLLTFLLLLGDYSLLR